MNTARRTSRSNELSWIEKAWPPNSWRAYMLREERLTILRTNQYQDLSSFSEVGTFLPLSTDAKGQLIREVAPARIILPRPDHPGAQLCLQVALIRDLRRLVAVRPDQEDRDLPWRWDVDRERTDPRWWEEGWQATAAPAKEMMAKLIPIVTTATIL